MNPTDATAALNPRTPGRRLIKWLAVGLGTAMLLIALALGTFTLAMARVPEYRLQMQAWLSQRARLDIEFESALAHWRTYGPELVLTRVVVRSPDRQRVLARADQGGVGFDLWRALRNGRLAAARIMLEGTEIKAQRRADGEFEFVGQADWPEFATQSGFKLDDLPIGTLAIRKVRLLFRDLHTGRGPWLIDQVAADITRAAGSFELKAQANLPRSLGKELRLTAHGEGRLSEGAQLRWQAQLRGTELDLRGWTQVMPDDWIAPAEGQGSFVLAADFIGSQPQRFSGHGDFVDVQMKLPKWSLPLPQADPLQVRDDDPGSTPVPQATAAASPVLADAPLRYRNIGLAFTGSHTGQDWQAHFERLQFSRDDSPWTPGAANVSIQFGSAESGRYLRELQADAQLIVLDNLWPLLAYLPETDANARLRALNTSGRIMNFAVRYQRSDERDAPRYGVRAEFAQLGVSPVGRTPGASGLSGVLTATGAHGELHLDSHEVALNLPRLFRTPLPLDQVTADLNWVRSGTTVRIHGTKLAVTSEDGKLQGQFTLDIPQNGAPEIDLQAEGTDLNAATAPRYLPAGAMPKRTLAWLDAAFPAGMVKHAQATLRGPLDKFPFRGDEGLFLIKARIEGLTLDYQPGWLPATNLTIDAEFHNAGLSAVARGGQVNGLTLSHAEGQVKDYRDSELNIKAQTQGDLADALGFVQHSPVGPAIGGLFQKLSGSGQFHGDASLYLPLKQFTRRKVDINASLQNATVNLAGFTQRAEQLNGRLRILNDAVVDADLHGQFLQGEFGVRTESAARGRYNVVANGLAQAPPLTQFLNLPAWIKLEGATRYRYTMPGYAQRDSEGTRHLYSIDSDLRGLGINLPVPAGKSAGDSRTLHIDSDLRGNDMLLRGALGELRALLRLQTEGEGWRFERGGLRADGIAAALPGHTGLRIDGRLDVFNLDDWLKLASNGGEGATLSRSSTAHVQDVLRAANVNIGRLRIFGFEWPEVRGILQATDAAWRVDVAGQQADGQVSIPYEFASGRPLTLSMEKLWLTPQSGDIRLRGAAPLDPRELPALHADIRHFRYGIHDFGALEVDGTRTAQGLQVGALHIRGDSFDGMGAGSWLQAPAGTQNTLMLTLNSSDVRATLQQFNYGDFIAAKRGKLVADLRWPGGLDESLLGRASGTLEVQVDEGQLLNVQPGAGRVLGLLSVAALPRRLGLDFHDLTDKGLAFDRIHADFTVQNGDAHTQNLLLHGPTAEIGIVGRMGLGARDYDQTAVVTGDVSSALPVAGVVAGGPVVGAALLLFSQIFKEPLKGVARAYYHIGGSWDDPQVERIDSEAGKASLSGAAAGGAP